MKRALVILMALLTCCGCKEAITTPTVPLPSGTATVTDTVIWPFLGTWVGFRCEAGETVSSADTADWHSLDIVTYPRIDWANQTAVPYLFRPGDTLIAGGFRLISKAASYQEARAQFQALGVAPDTGYHIIADSVQPNELWAFQTIGGKYAKLLVREVHSRVGLAISDTLAIEVTFDWVFQPDGTKRLKP